MKGKNFIAIILAGIIVNSAACIPQIACNNNSIVAAASAFEGMLGENVSWSLDENGVLTLSGSGASTDWKYSAVSFSNDKTNHTFIDPVNPIYEIREAVKSIVVEEGVTTIGQLTFTGCSNLKSVSLPASLTAINKYAFSGCSQLEEIIIPENVNEIGESAFYYCERLKKITLPQKMNCIDEAAFAYCKVLETIELPQGLEKIENNCFEDCISLTSISIPEGVKEIKSRAFEDCENLISVTFPSTLEAIGYSTFEGCVKLENPVFGDNLKYIDSDAFNNCIKIDKVTLPATVKRVDSSAFFECINLKEIIVDENNENLCSDGGVLYTKNKTRLIKYPECKEDESFIIPDSVVTVENSAISNQKYLTYVKTGKYTSTIEEYAFISSAKLEEIHLLSNVTTLGRNATEECTALKKATIENPECVMYYKIFVDNKELDDYNNKDTIYESAVIYGYENSTAHDYAKLFEREFIALAKPEVSLGDIDASITIDAVDASMILSEYARISTGSTTTFTEEQMKAADINDDGAVNASDASIVLSYYAYISTGGELSLEEYITNNN